MHSSNELDILLKECVEYIHNYQLSDFKSNLAMDFYKKFTNKNIRIASYQLDDLKVCYSAYSGLLDNERLTLLCKCILDSFNERDIEEKEADFYGCIFNEYVGLIYSQIIHGSSKVGLSLYSSTLLRSASRNLNIISPENLYDFFKVGRELSSCGLRKHVPTFTIHEFGRVFEDASDLFKANPVIPNIALSALIQNSFNKDRLPFKGHDFISTDNNEAIDCLRKLSLQIVRLHNGGLSINIGHPDIVLIAMICSRLSLASGHSTNDNDKTLYSDAAFSLLKMVTPENYSSVKLSTNLFKVRINSKYWHEYDVSDLLDKTFVKLVPLCGSNFNETTKLAADDFNFYLLRSALQSSNGKMKQSEYDDSHIIESLIFDCRDVINDNKNLKFMSTGEVARLACLCDKDLKSQLVQRNKFIRGDVLEHDLGL